MRNRLMRYWRIYSTMAGVFVIASALTYVVITASTGEQNDPVVIVRDFRLHTPVVPAKGEITFSLWRNSSESCPGTAVIAFSSLDVPSTIVSVRYPYATPGYNSPPRLTITRQLPVQVTPGKWRVQTGVDSRCPTRQRYDETGNFELEVIDEPVR